VNALLKGLSTKSKFVTKHLINFLLGKTSSPIITNPNHNMKNLRYQVLGGSDVVTCGTSVINPQLLCDVGIPEPLYRVIDWASDKVVLQLVSSDTLMSIHKHVQQVIQQNSISAAEYRSIVATVYMLYFMRVHLYCVNAKSVPVETQIFGLWTSTIWFTSLRGISNVTIKNIVLATVGIIFAVCRSDVMHPWFLTTEPLEHHFGDT